MGCRFDIRQLICIIDSSEHFLTKIDGVDFLYDIFDGESTIICKNVHSSHGNKTNQQIKRITFYTIECAREHCLLLERICHNIQLLQLIYSLIGTFETVFFSLN